MPKKIIDENTLSKVSGGTNQEYETNINGEMKCPYCQNYFSPLIFQSHLINCIMKPLGGGRNSERP